MTAIATTIHAVRVEPAGGPGTDRRERRRSDLRPSPAPHRRAATTDTVELSDRAKAILDKADADKAATAELSLSFDEILQKRSDALTSRLTDAFKGMNVNLDEAVRLQVDKFGNVTTEGSWKAKIEKFFADNPDLAKELKAIAGLNALKAADHLARSLHQGEGRARRQQAAAEGLDRLQHPLDQYSDPGRRDEPAGRQAAIRGGGLHRQHRRSDRRERGRRRPGAAAARGRQPPRLIAPGYFG